MTLFPLRTRLFLIVLPFYFCLPVRAQGDTTFAKNADGFIMQLVSAIKSGEDSLYAFFPDRAATQLIFNDAIFARKKALVKTADMKKLEAEMERDARRQSKKIMDSLAADSVSLAELVYFESSKENLRPISTKLKGYMADIVLVQYNPEKPRLTRKIFIEAGLLYVNRRWCIFGIRYKGIKLF